MPHIPASVDPPNRDLFDTCRMKAAECRLAGAATDSDVQSDHFMNMADEWDALARALEDGYGGVAELTPVKPGQGWKLR
jgi:hypothetical protein